MKTEWVVVHATTDAAYASIVKAKLGDNGISAVAVNKQDQVNIHLNQFSEIQILVRRDDVLRANHLISNLDE